jgi:hypothetical protein
MVAIDRSLGVWAAKGSAAVVAIAVAKNGYGPR